MVNLLWTLGLAATLAKVHGVPLDLYSLDSDLGNVTDLSTDLGKRESITVKLSNVVIAASSVVIAANAGIDLYDNIAAKIKAKSDANSCSQTSGTQQDDGYNEGFSYQTSTSGKNCDTTAELKTIQAAVQNCANQIHAASGGSGCCVMSHGGTWTGHLEISGDPNKYSYSLKC